MICLCENGFLKLLYLEVIIDIFYCWIFFEFIIDVFRLNGSVFIFGKVMDLLGGSLNILKIGDEVCGIMFLGWVLCIVIVFINNVFVKLISLIR